MLSYLKPFPRIMPIFTKNLSCAPNILSPPWLFWLQSRVCCSLDHKAILLKKKKNLAYSVIVFTVSKYSAQYFNFGFN